MPISTKSEESESDMVTITPPTPETSLPDAKDNSNGDIKPILNLDNKFDVEHLESKGPRVSDERQKQIDTAAKTIREYREK
jgi:hypothetical protein